MTTNRPAREELEKLLRCHGNYPCDEMAEGHDSGCPAHYVNAILSWHEAEVARAVAAAVEAERAPLLMRGSLETCDSQRKAVAALEPVRELIAKATALTEKLKAIHADPRYQGVWMVSQIHVGQYEGPKYDQEQDALDAALAALEAAARGEG